MKKANQRNDDLRPEYAFSSMNGAIRGKYAKRFREGTNVVLLQPEIAEAFPTESAVNEALQGILDMTRAIRRTGGLPNKSLQSGSRVSKRRPQRAPRGNQ